MKEYRKSVALVGSSHAESLRTIERCRTTECASFILYGDEEATYSCAKELGIDLSGVHMVPTESPSDSCMQAMEAAARGEIQVLMKGSVHTADLLKAILNKEYGLLSEGALLSHVARLELPWYHKPLLLSDAAVSILPDIDTKVQIIQNAVSVAHRLGIEKAKVALVCPVETANPRIVSTTDASQIVFLQKNTTIFSQAVIEGPFGLDVALSVQAAKIKRIEGSVPGQADILIFGNLDAANATYKAFLSAPGVLSAGIVVGAKLPIVLTSRSESMETREASIRLALSISDHVSS